LDTGYQGNERQKKKERFNQKIGGLETELKRIVRIWTSARTKDRKWNWGGKAGKYLGEEDLVKNEETQNQGRGKRQGPAERQKEISNNCCRNLQEQEGKRRERVGPIPPLARRWGIFY